MQHGSTGGIDIRRFALFANLTDDDAAALQRAVQVRRLASGARIFDQDEPAQGFFLIDEGAVKVFKVSASGQEQVLHVSGKGQSFAEAAVFLGGHYPANAECVEESVLVFVERTVLLHQIRRDPDLALRMLAGLAMKHHHLVSLVEDLTLRDARGRICRYLLGLLPDAGDAHAPLTVRLPVSQTLLARLLGVTGETLSRVLKALDREGIITTQGRGVMRIIDIAALRGAVEGDL